MKFIETASGIVFTRGGGCGEGGVSVNRQRVSIGEDVKSSGDDGGDGSNVNVLNATGCLRIVRMVNLCCVYFNTIKIIII